MLYSIAPLSDDQLRLIQELEKATGRTLLALKRLDVLPDRLSDEELARIQELEVTLGMALVAVVA
ncbi:MAG: hypothetical protein ABIL09_09700 [Gemmatimonadota bacterium]